MGRSLLIYGRKKSIGLHVAAWLFLAVGCLRAQVLSPDANLTAREEQIIAAAKADAPPQFKGTPINQKCAYQERYNCKSVSLRKMANFIRKVALSQLDQRFRLYKMKTFTVPSHGHHE